MEKAKWQTENSIKSVYCTEFHQAFRSISKRKKREEKNITNRFQYLDKFIRKQNAQPEQSFYFFGPKVCFFRQMKTFWEATLLLCTDFIWICLKTKHIFLPARRFKYIVYVWQKARGQMQIAELERDPHNAKRQVKPAPDCRPTNIYIDTSLRLHIF